VVLMIGKIVYGHTGYSDQREDLAKFKADIAAAAPGTIIPVKDPEVMLSALNTQIGGDHYKSKGIQPIEYIQANNIGFTEGNVIKYLTRWRDKGGLQDLRKARHYIDLLIEYETALLPNPLAK
jgi:hypothetical protein